MRIHRVLADLCDRELTIATAESCTGGLLASVLTDVEGLGHAFDRGYVTYTDQAKIMDLGVPSDLIALNGAVSAQVADAMAVGALSNAKADLALAITGFAGPAGTNDEEGRVHLSLSQTGHHIRRRDCRFGKLGRGPIRIAALNVAVSLIEDALAEQSSSPFVTSIIREAE